MADAVAWATRLVIPALIGMGLLVPDASENPGAACDTVAEQFRDLADAPAADYVANRAAFLEVAGARAYLAKVSVGASTAIERGIAEALLLRIERPALVDAIENHPCNKWKPGAKADFECERERVDVYARAPVLAFELLAKGDHWCCKSDFVEIVAHSDRDRYERVEALLGYRGAAAQLVRIDPVRSIPRLLQEAQGGSQWTDDAIVALGSTRTSDPQVHQLIRDRFRRNHSHTAAWALAELGDRAFADEMLAAVDDSSESRLIMNELTRLLGSTELGTRIDALARSASPRERKIAAHALGIETRVAQPRATVLIQLASDADDDVRAAALHSIFLVRCCQDLAFDDVTLLPLVLDATRARSVDVRRFAVDILTLLAYDNARLIRVLQQVRSRERDARLRAHIEERIASAR